MDNFVTRLVVPSDPGKEKREAAAQTKTDLEELKEYLSETRPLVLIKEGREAVLKKIQTLLA